MADKFWRELTKQSKLEEMYEIFRKDTTATDKEVAIRLARFSEAYVFNNAKKLCWFGRFWTWLTRKRAK